MKYRNDYETEEDYEDACGRELAQQEDDDKTRRAEEAEEKKGCVSLFFVVAVRFEANCGQMGKSNARLVELAKQLDGNAVDNRRAKFQTRISDGEAND